MSPTFLELLKRFQVLQCGPLDSDNINIGEYVLYPRVLSSSRTLNLNVEAAGSFETTISTYSSSQWYNLQSRKITTVFNSLS
jgi:hypothetical protein